MNVVYNIDPYYFRAQEDRYQNHITQMSLFIEEEVNG